MIEKETVLKIHKYALNNNVSFTKLEEVFHVDRKKIPRLFEKYNLEYSSPYNKDDLIMGKQKEVYKLFFLEGLTVANISNKTNLSRRRIINYLKTYENYDKQLSLNKKYAYSVNNKLTDLEKSTIYYLFFQCSKTISNILIETGLGRSTVTNYLNQFAKYEATMKYNKKLSEQKREIVHYDYIYGEKRDFIKNNTVYKYTNTINNKVYIGITHDEKKRIEQHKMARDKTAFHNAVNKYGYENFIYKVLDRNLTRFDAEQKEIYYIEKYNSYRQGYNSTLGGEKGFKHSFSIEDVSNMYSKYKTGKSLKSVGKEHGVSSNVVKRFFEYYNFELRKPQSVARADRLNELEHYSDMIIEMYKYNSLKTIAKHISEQDKRFTYSQPDIKHILINHNIVLRSGNSKVEMLSDDNIIELCNYYTNGKSMKFISQKYCISRKSIEDILISQQIFIRSH